MKRIFLVEDDKAIAKNLMLLLRSEGYTVTHAPTQSEAIDLVSVNRFDLALVDISLPDGNGFTVCTEIKETQDIPVIFLTASGDEASVVTGLNMGADDYITKPFGVMELQARVKAVLRRTERRGDRVLTWGDVELDPAAREVHKAGKPVELTYKEFELLKLLFSRRGVALTRDEILQAVWDYDYTGETRTVDMHVKALRQKLGEDIITTVRGVGYKMV